MTESNEHKTVLLHEAIAALQIKAGGVYVDGTFGRGGHSAEILQALGANGRLIALDRDDVAIEVANNRFHQENRFSIYKNNFSQLESVMSELQLSGMVDGVLLDLGVSSPQLDVASRGFSFSVDGPLDMRMDTSQQLSAQSWLAQVTEAELAQVLWEFGEERFSRRIARAIVSARETEPVMTTLQLAEIIKAAHPAWDHRRHPATRSFQAIRIRVNDELAAVRSVIDQASRVLKTGGRLAVISFHSLEDRIVKRVIRGSDATAHEPVALRHLPLQGEKATQKRQWARIGKPIKAGPDELAVNPRARSAVLRVAEKVGERGA